MNLWKIYAVAFSAIVILSGFGRLFLYYRKPGSTSRLDLVSGFYGFVMIPGLLGYAWLRPEGPQYFWPAAVLLQIGFSVAELLSPKSRTLIEKLGILKATSVFLLQFALGGPALYALIRYAFFSPNIWN